MIKKGALAAVLVIAMLSLFADAVHAQSDTTPPTVPTGFTATVNASNQVVLIWNVSTDDTGVAGYYVYRNGSMIGTTAGTTYTDTPPAGSSIYHVAAYDAAGNVSPQSIPGSVNVVPDLTPPSAPTNLAASVSSSSIVISWTASTDNVAVVGYNIYRNGAQLNSSLVTGTSYTDPSTYLVSDGQYTYTVTAYDAARNASQQGAVRVRYDITPPSIPEGFNAVPYADHITLSWYASTDNVAVVGYHLYRNGTDIADPTNTTYTDTGLATSTSYSYSLTAYDAAGNLSNVTALTSTTLIAPLPVSAPPPTPLPISSAVSPEMSGQPANPAPPADTPTNIGVVFTLALHVGSRNGDVKNLQLFLIEDGDLSATYATGYFGVLTQKALQSFQCKQSIICSGGPSTTGWGAVGPRTRKILNALY